MANWSDSEIKTHFRWMKHDTQSQKNQAVRILSELSGRTQGEIMAVCGVQKKYRKGTGRYKLDKEEGVLEMYRSGGTDREIAAKYDVSPGEVRLWRMSKNLPLNPTERVARNVTALVDEMIKSGARVSEIVKKANCSDAYVYKRRKILCSGD